MAELSFKQITDKLNTEFTGEVRKLIFWYDEAAEFRDDVDGLELVNAKVYHLKPDNQFYTKYFLECVTRQRITWCMRRSRNRSWQQIIWRTQSTTPRNSLRIALRCLFSI